MILRHGHRLPLEVTRQHRLRGPGSRGEMGKHPLGLEGGRQLPEGDPGLDDREPVPAVDPKDLLHAGEIQGDPALPRDGVPVKLGKPRAMGHDGDRLLVGEPNDLPDLLAPSHPDQAGGSPGRREAVVRRVPFEGLLVVEEALRADDLPQARQLRVSTHGRSSPLFSGRSFNPGGPPPWEGTRPPPTGEISKLIYQGIPTEGKKKSAGIRSRRRGPAEKLLDKGDTPPGEFE